LECRVLARNGHGGAVTACPLLGGEAENICSQRVFRLLTHFGSKKTKARLRKPHCCVRETLQFQASAIFKEVHARHRVLPVASYCECAGIISCLFSLPGNMTNGCVGSLTSRSRR
jgi:hypothetical protein